MVSLVILFSRSSFVCFVVGMQKLQTVTGNYGQYMGILSNIWKLWAVFIHMWVINPMSVTLGQLYRHTILHKPPSLFWATITQENRKTKNETTR